MPDASTAPYTSASPRRHHAPMPARTALLMLVALTRLCPQLGAFAPWPPSRRAAAGRLCPVAPGAGVFAATFHFTFGAMQLFMGIGIDLYGVRRTILAAFPLCITGALLSALALAIRAAAGAGADRRGLRAGLLVCTVFIARHFAPQRFAAISAWRMALVLFTGTPLAWLVHNGGAWRPGESVLARIWRCGFWAAPLAAGTPEAWRDRCARVLRFARLFALPHTRGIGAGRRDLCGADLAARALAGAHADRAPWFSLVQSGNVALALSVVALAGPMLFGA